MTYFEKVFHAVVLSCSFSFFSALAFANDADYGSTWQVKCEQKEMGREVQCWLVEVPNKPVVGIDVPFEEAK